ncbi:peptide ABC transporter substrate-binding protein [Pradoshia sp.]|uniref:peptide ABC transporter substrate-binding protein n=1 Tax=Pradoshia sp. TaxID=2651281 RepID=UPI003F0EF798
MKVKKKTRFLFICLFVVCLALVGCQQDNESGSESQGKETSSANQVLKVSANDIATINTLGSYDVPSSIVMNNIFEGLYRLDENNEPTPGIAKSYEVSDDQLSYTFKLREGAEWSNGTPVTAHDFEYAWKRAHSSSTLSPFSYLMAPLKNSIAIQTKDHELFDKVDELGIKATDDYTLQVELENPSPYFLSLLTTPVFFPQNQEFVESQGENYALGTDHLIYNGPFTLEDWKQGASWTYKKNKDYWDAESVAIDSIEANVINDTATAVNMFESGELDAIGLSAEFVDQYSSTPEYKSSLDPTVYFIRMNQQNKYLANVNIRKALDLGWNKKDIESILNNGSLAAHFVVPKEFTKDESGKDFRAKYDGFNETNTQEATEYWNKGLKELGVKEIELELLSYDSDITKTVAQYVKNQLEKNLPGLTLNVNQQPSKQKLDLEAKQDYELSYSGWSPDYHDPISFLEIFHTNNPYNWMNFSNKEFDQLIDAAYKETDIAKRWGNLQEAERILIEENAAVSPMFQAGKTTLTKTNVKGIADHPYGGNKTYKWVKIN